MTQFTYFDIFVAVIVFLSTLGAFFKGFSREIVRIAIMILGFVLASVYYKVPAGMLLRFCNETLADLCGFLAIFLGCILAGALITAIVDRFLKAVKLKWADRLLGAAFGFIRGCVICSILSLALTVFPVKEDIMAKSVLAPYMLGCADILIHFVPQDMRDEFDAQYQKVMKIWHGGAKSL